MRYAKSQCRITKNMGHLSSHDCFTHLCTAGLFHCYLLDEALCHFRGARSVLSLSFYFLWKILLANNVDFDQIPHYVASDLGLHCLSIQVRTGYRGMYSPWVQNLIRHAIVIPLCLAESTQAADFLIYLK